MHGLGWSSMKPTHTRPRIVWPDPDRCNDDWPSYSGPWQEVPDGG